MTVVFSHEIAVFTIGAALDVSFPCHNILTENTQPPPCLGGEYGGKPQQWKLGP